MEITLRDLKACERGLTKLVNSDLPIHVSFRMSKVLKVVRESLQEVESVRTKLIAKHSSASEDGPAGILPGSDAEKAFLAEFTPLLEEKVDLGSFEPISLNEISNTAMSPVEIEPLIGIFLVELTQPSLALVNEDTEVKPLTEQ